MKSSCFCGAGLVTFRARMMRDWLGSHNCPGAPTPDREGERDEHVFAGEARSERSYPDEAYYDGDRYLPSVNTRAPIGFMPNRV